MAKQTLDQWIREALIDEDKDGKCTRLALVHIAGGRESEISAMKLGSKPWDPKELALIFRKKAEDHCSEISGVQTFNLLAFYGDRGEPQARRPFSVQGEPPPDQVQLLTEGPTPQGIVQQSMRHNEALMQLALRHSAAMVEASERMVTRVSLQNERLSSELMEATGIIRELAFERQDVADSRKMQQLQFQRTTEERNKWLSFGPALINAVLNREVFPQSTADTALIDSIVDSLTEDDIMKLGSSGIIKPEIWGPLAQRMASSLKKRRELSESNEEIARISTPENELQ